MAKGVVEIAASLEQIARVLADNKTHHEWIPHLQESRELEATSATERLEYNRFKAPWPAADRDFVYRVIASGSVESGYLKFEMRSEVNALMPEQPRLIRGELLTSSYTLTQLNAERCQIELIFSVDPRGMIPHWIVNRIQTHWPHFILRELKQRLEAS